MFSTMKAWFQKFWIWQPSKDLQLSWWWQTLKETKIPGLKDALKEGIHVALRILWLLIVASLLGLSLFWIMEQGGEISTNPIKLSPHNKLVPLRQVVFPAITFGKRMNIPEQIPKELTKAYQKTSKNRNAEWLWKGKILRNPEIDKLITIVRDICLPFNELSKWQSGNQHPSSYRDPALPISLLKVTDGGSTALLDLAQKFVFTEIPDCTRFLTSCSVNGKYRNCESVFYDSFTNLGFGCSANILPHELLLKNYNGTLKSQVQSHRNLSDEERQSWESWRDGRRDEKLSQIPLTQKQSGQQGGFSFVLNFDLDMNYDGVCMQSELEGYYLTVHSPDELPDLVDTSIFVEPNTELDIVLRATIVKAEPNIEAVIKELRSCLFPKEAALELFQRYTSRNCKMECLSKAIHKKCACNRINDPKKLNTRLCAQKDDECVTNAQVSFYGEGNDDCSKTCLSRCEETTYIVTTKTRKYSPDNPPHIVSHTLGFNATSAVIHVYFEDQHYPHFKRDYEFSFAEKIGVIGGIIGLTNGLSFIDAGRVVLAMLLMAIPWALLDGWFGKAVQFFRRKILGTNAPPPSARRNVARAIQSWFPTPPENVDSLLSDIRPIPTWAEILEACKRRTEQDGGGQESQTTEFSMANVAKTLMGLQRAEQTQPDSELQMVEINSAEVRNCKTRSTSPSESNQSISLADSFQGPTGPRPTVSITELVLSAVMNDHNLTDESPDENEFPELTTVQNFTESESSKSCSPSVSSTESESKKFHPTNGTLGKPRKRKRRQNLFVKRSLPSLPETVIASEIIPEPEESKNDGDAEEALKNDDDIVIAFDN